MFRNIGGSTDFVCERVMNRRAKERRKQKGPALRRPFVWSLKRGRCSAGRLPQRALLIAIRN